MGWLAPGFLLGALAIGVPIWLHLLKRSASRPRQFSSLMLFEPQQRSTRSFSGAAPGRCPRT